jgi:hypothetical protein
MSSLDDHHPRPERLRIAHDSLEGDRGLPDDDRRAREPPLRVNARFAFPSPNASTPCWVARLPK